jgi:lipid II:glycine glycyltransferase (peptidoglycan interpeptide bridge formation enzyme)
MKLIQIFPQSYKLFSVSMKNEMVAATVCVKVKDSILYNFLPAHNSSFNMYSPMVFLMEKIYQYTSEKKIRFIDLGVSSINNNPQKGLIRFKERLGSKAVGKLTFLKEI